MNFILKLDTKKVLILFFILAVIIRLIYFKNSVTFFYDQARDAFAAMEIWQGDPVKILGPQTDFPGLHHGPLYWYLISPFYFLSGGNVWLVRLFFIILSSSSLFFVYDLTKSLFNKKRVGVISALLFAFSFEATQYARWLSNPAPALFTIAVSFWAFEKLIKGKSWALPLLAVFWGLSIQFQIFLVYQFIVFIAIWLMWKGLTLPKVNLKSLFISILLLLVTVSSYIAAEIKFKFIGIKTLLAYLTMSHGSVNIVKQATSYFETLISVFKNNIWVLDTRIATILTVITIALITFYVIKNKNRKQLLFLSIWLVSPIIIIFLNGPNTNFINLGVLIPAIIITSFFLSDFLSKPSGKYKLLAILAIVVIVVSNLKQIIIKNKEGESLFTIQKQMILGDELNIIDWIYGEADGKQFRLNTITNPLFINSTWAYLFNWYAKDKYTYMPIWWGETQVNVPGSNIQFANPTQTDLEFLIVEPTSSGNDYYIRAVESLENTRSQIIKTQKFGYFTVEKRKITRERIFTSEDAFWVIQNKAY